MVFSGYMSRSRIGGSYDIFILSFIRNLHTVLHKVAKPVYIPTKRVGGELTFIVFPLLLFAFLSHMLLSQLKK